jgi:hypothetical protein
MKWILRSLSYRFAFEMMHFKNAGSRAPRTPAICGNALRAMPSARRIARLKSHLIIRVFRSFMDLGYIFGL